MKNIRLLLWALLCPFALLTSCSSDDDQPEQPIQVIYTAKSALQYGACNDPKIEFQVLPAQVLEQQDVQIRVSDSNGNALPQFELSNLNKMMDGKCTATLSFKSDRPVTEDVHLCVTSGTRKGISDSIKLLFVDANIEEFSIEGFKAAIQNGEGTISLVVPYLTDKSNIQVNFRLSAGNLIKDGKTLLSGVGTIDITQSNVLTLSWGEMKRDYTLDVKNTNLPIVNIKTPNKQPITSKEDWMAGATMTILLPDGTLDYEGSMSIRGRGNSTWNYVKKPYALKLDSKAEILGMPKHKRWILLAQWKDRTLMRNDAAFWLSKQTDLDYTVRGQFVEVILNGKFLGNYYLCEQIKIDKNRVNVKEMNDMETDPKKITGGYLIELDTYFDEVNQFKSLRFNLPYMIKEPDEDALSEEAFQYVKNYVNELETILQDEERIQNHEYEDYYDVDSSIDWFFVHELATNVEPHSSWPWVGPHSCYMHKDRGGKFVSGPVWDFDYKGFTPEGAKSWQCRDALYFRALVKDERYRKRMRERWDMLKEKFAKLPEYIDQQADHIRLSEGINQDMWPINNSENGDEKMTFQQAVDRMKSAFKTKFNWIEANLDKLK